MDNKQQLYEITILRPIIIGLLVLMHSFTMYGGAWSLPEGIRPVPAYWWIAKISFSFLLETFVFISGYILCFQMQRKRITFPSLVQKKLKRIYLPSIVFSILYFCCFSTYKNAIGCVYSILNGCGHLWFLPMLFWCFIGGYALLQLQIPDWIKLLCLLLLAIISGPLSFLPLRIGNACYYLFFFYTGVVVHRQKDNILHFFTRNRVVWTILVYIAVVVGGLLFNNYLQSIDNAASLWHLPIVFAKTAVKMLYATVGTVMSYLVVNLIIKSRVEIGEPWTTFNQCCFGVYIYHQFILEYLYYHTALPTSVGSYWLPWVGLAVALPAAFILSYVTRATKAGQFLIG